MRYPKLGWVVGAALFLLVSALAVWPVMAQEGPSHIVIPAEQNLVLHSADELADVLRKQGMDEASIQRVLELERRIERAHAQGLSYDELRRNMEQWIQELFPKNPTPDASPDRDSSAETPRPLAWFVHYAGIYACCANPAARGDWGMPGYRSVGAWFRSSAGNYYYTSAYCPYSSCSFSHIARGEHNWDYHAVAMWNTWPYWHSAYCYR